MGWNVWVGMGGGGDLYARWTRRGEGNDKTEANGTQIRYETPKKRGSERRQKRREEGRKAKERMGKCNWMMQCRRRVSRDDSARHSPPS